MSTSQITQHVFEESYRNSAVVDRFFIQCMKKFYKKPTSEMSETDKVAVLNCSKKLLHGYNTFLSTWNELRPQYEVPEDEDGDGDDEDEEEEDDD